MKVEYTICIGQSGFTNWPTDLVRPGIGKGVVEKFVIEVFKILYHRHKEKLLIPLCARQYLVLSANSLTFCLEINNPIHKR